jgi:hypothetical protein
VESHRGVAFTDAQGEGDVLDRHVLKRETGDRLEILGQAAHRLDQAAQPLGVGRGFIDRGPRIGQGVAQRLGLTDQGAPDMGDANILGYAGGPCPA